MQRQASYSIKDFQVLGKVGQGSFGSVYKAKNKKSGEVVALKEIKVSASDRKNIEGIAQEMRILCSIDHKNIVSYKCSFWNSRKTSIYIVMEFLGGGDLQEKINKCKKRRNYMPESKIWSYFIQMLTGLKVLHELKIIHRDIKSANTFLSQDLETCKLGDMNVSKITRNNFAKTQVGTPLYISPEIWKGRQYSYKTDIWSLGCLLYEMCTLNYPFLGMNMNDLKRSVLRGRFSPIPNFYDKDLTKVIKMCLQINPSSRPSVGQLLRHPMVEKRIKINHENTVRDLGNMNLKLIDTIKIPWDFRKMKLPSKEKIEEIKKKRVRRSNSVAGVRPRPESARGNKEEYPRVKFERKQSEPNVQKVPPANPSNKRNFPPIKPSKGRGNKIPPKPRQRDDENPVLRRRPSAPDSNYGGRDRRPSAGRLPSVEGKRSGSRGSRGSRCNSRNSRNSRGSRERRSSKENISNVNAQDPYGRRRSKDRLRKQSSRDRARKNSSRNRSGLRRAPSAGGRMNGYRDSRPKWWG